MLWPLFTGSSYLADLGLGNPKRPGLGVSLLQRLVVISTRILWKAAVLETP